MMMMTMTMMMIIMIIIMSPFKTRWSISLIVCNQQHHQVCSFFVSTECWCIGAVEDPAWYPLHTYWETPMNIGRNTIGASWYFRFLMMEWLENLRNCQPFGTYPVLLFSEVLYKFVYSKSVWTLPKKNLPFLTSGPCSLVKTRKPHGSQPISWVFFLDVRSANYKMPYLFSSNDAWHRRDGLWSAPHVLCKLQTISSLYWYVYE